MKTKSVVLFILFAVMCVSVIAAGMLAIRYTQGTGNAADWWLVLMSLLIAIADLLVIRSIYYAA